METLTEDYIGFETAKLLKEKGFDVGVRHYYQKIDDDITYHIEDFRNWNVYDMWYSMPTLQMAMKWIREVHKIFICIEFDAPTFVADMYKMDEIDEYGCAKHIPPTIANCKTYEEAVEAGIKYALENLI